MTDEADPNWLHNTEVMLSGICFRPIMTRWPTRQRLACMQPATLCNRGAVDPEPHSRAVSHADELLAIARKVADLDLMLLTDLPGIESLPAVRVLVVGFGAAWAGDDVLFGLGSPLAWAAEQAAGVSAAPGRSPLCLPPWPARAIMCLSSSCTCSPALPESTSGLLVTHPQQSAVTICRSDADGGMTINLSAVTRESCQAKLKMLRTKSFFQDIMADAHRTLSAGVSQMGLRRDYSAHFCQLVCVLRVQETGPKTRC